MARSKRRKPKNPELRVPKAWKKTLTGEPMPDVVRAIRRSRRGH